MHDGFEFPLENLVLGLTVSSETEQLFRRVNRHVWGYLAEEICELRPAVQLHNETQCWFEIASRTMTGGRYDYKYCSMHMELCVQIMENHS